MGFLCFQCPTNHLKISANSLVNVEANASRIEFQTFQLDAALRGKQIPGVNTAIGFTAWWFNHHQIQT